MVYKSKRGGWYTVESNGGRGGGRMDSAMGAPKAANAGTRTTREDAGGAVGKSSLGTQKNTKL